MLGRHAGVIHFTVGQRRGIGVAAGDPLYVVRLDAARAAGRGRTAGGARTSRLRLREVNWIGDDTIEHALCAGWMRFRQGRSTRPPQPAWLSRGARGIEVDLIAGEDGVSPGQACVFYDAAEGQARVLGGGFIETAVAAIECPTIREAGLPSGMSQL